MVCLPFPVIDCHVWFMAFFDPHVCILSIHLYGMLELLNHSWWEVEQELIQASLCDRMSTSAWKPHGNLILTWISRGTRRACCEVPARLLSGCKKKRTSGTGIAATAATKNFWVDTVIKIWTTSQQDKHVVLQQLNNPNSVRLGDRKTISIFNKQELWTCLFFSARGDVLWLTSAAVKSFNGGFAISIWLISPAWLCSSSLWYGALFGSKT